ncbi:hypothetical protein [Streptomyces sp. CA-179760]|uniref:hypothetical protein n=1 Tax=Streptomyces sp. CA-179760 TaxID=3240054 RepID=UPI003D949D90
MRLIIDMAADSYEQAIAAVQAAYGLRPGADWSDAPTAERRTGPEGLGGDDLGDGWTDRLLFQMIASLMPGARAVLRRIVEVGGTASYDDVQQYFAEHPTARIPRAKIGGSLTSVKVVQRRVGPAGAGQLLQRDEQARLYRIDRALVEGLQRAFALADCRPDLMRREADSQGARMAPSLPRHRPTAAPGTQRPLPRRTDGLGRRQGPHLRRPRRREHVGRSHPWRASARLGGTSAAPVGMLAARRVGKMARRDVAEAAGRPVFLPARALLVSAAGRSCWSSQNARQR